ncbi:hypothetical protein FTUN_7275 [Frigoriglobus tundricola]|uniref:Probable membrane transporter protein n=2 Tax=Frigoriglobus tundricola TaxID=2774151 RepID=A0A6M5Z1N4_9BACT|nr:hypothetical protein FTUN_7275 [Frigoriglobus tundricola]
MTYLVVCSVSFVASGLTLFSGFGLGTLLLPAFALFFPVERAVALTAIVHFLNGLFKLALVGRHADRRAVQRFGAPAILAALVGAWVLLQLTELPPLASYTLFGREFRVAPVKFAMGWLLAVFALIDLIPYTRDLTFSSKYLPLGGALSGFFGGLSGMQGALRSAFLLRAGLSKEAFVATGVVVACLIDFTRLGVYVPAVLATGGDLDYALLAAAVLSAFAGAFLGARYLKKVTLRGVQLIVAAMLLLVAMGLASGVL